MSISPRTAPTENASALVDAIAARLIALRAERGWSASALARRAGMAKSTLTQLEQGNGNPGIETLWALAAALGVPFADLLTGEEPPVQVVRANQGTTTQGENADYRARLMARLQSTRQQSLYHLDIAPAARHDARPHPPGTSEHLIVTAGGLTAGPQNAPVTLAVGDYLRFAADVDHTYVADATTGASAILIIAYA
ncbi:helix-turn-helix domain-containing protein [Salinisphaera sp. Q1T1-3]|uniref:helix-turn-helix domain-containing protein n=1 Tax=Salinisphaera sp. Q1T1-3 TaxID=2321229 RepID=UPI001313F555|nr:XRE family transcriptional regulator [Salinisphaera sp. Q1T1-3]